jgi:hypothetical protein
MLIRPTVSGLRSRQEVAGSKVGIEVIMLSKILEKILTRVNGPH